MSASELRIDQIVRCHNAVSEFLVGSINLSDVAYHEFTVYVLLDRGLMFNFVMNRLPNKLKLLRKKTNIHIAGIRGSENRSSSLVHKN